MKLNVISVDWQSGSALDQWERRSRDEKTIRKLFKVHNASAGVAQLSVGDELAVRSPSPLTLSSSTSPGVNNVCVIPEMCLSIDDMLSGTCVRGYKR